MTYPMITELAPFEPRFLVYSLALREPWPPEPYMRAGARATFSAAMAEAKFAEALARSAIVAMYQEELRDVLKEVDLWTELARVHLLERAKQWEESLWNPVNQPAPEVQLEDVDAIDVPVRSRWWVWDPERDSWDGERGCYARREEGEDE